MAVVKLLGLVVLLQVCVCQVDERYSMKRPIWNVAHMVNNRNQADKFLDLGANGLEFDVTFNWEGNAKYTYHGWPCDCFRNCFKYEYFEVFIDYMRQLTTPGNYNFRDELVLLFLDLKVSKLSSKVKLRAGADVAKKILNVYWQRGRSKARSYILISIPSVQHLETAYGFRKYLKDEGFSQYESMYGFDFSGIEAMHLIRGAYISLNVTDHIWLGDGNTNCFARSTRRLREAINRRDHPRYAFMDKVYYWTTDTQSTMRRILRLGADALLVNHPDNLITVLKDEEFSTRFRLANIHDSPWEKFVP